MAVYVDFCYFIEFTMNSYFAHFAFEESCCEPGLPVPILACWHLAPHPRGLAARWSQLAHKTQLNESLSAGYLMSNQYNRTKPERYRC